MDWEASVACSEGVTGVVTVEVEAEATARGKVETLKIVDNKDLFLEGDDDDLDDLLEEE